MQDNNIYLNDDSHVAVIGGGPAGSFFSFFLIDMAERSGLDIHVDIFETRDFSHPGPKGCNMCGGIISETLIQLLAIEGIILPPSVVQRAIDSYMLHMDVGDVRIATPLEEKRIGAVYRGSGPRDIQEIKWGSFDGHLQKLALDKGAQVVNDRVDSIRWEAGKPYVQTRNGMSKIYDLIAVATGVNSASQRLFQQLNLEYQAPQTTKTYIREFYLGEEKIGKELGPSMHVFLLDLPRLEFAAIIPKGDYVSLCMLGEDIDKELVQSFLHAPEVMRCFPPDMPVEAFSCQCSPRINVRGAVKPFADRIVFIGDIGVTRLYKDGIGAAYRTAKAAASTAIFQGISAADFERHYWPSCQAIEIDNTIGKVVFLVTRVIQKLRIARRAVLRMTLNEQQSKNSHQQMSTVLWDMFTGSAPYREIFLRTLHPSFLLRLIGNLAASIISRP